MSYPSDLTEAPWQLLAPLLPPPKAGGRPRSQELRPVVNAILYVTATGVPWRFLPHDFPNYNTVFGYFTRWKKEGIMELIQAHLRDQVRLLTGPSKDPTVSIIDSQSVKTVETANIETKGYDVHKATKGRKRHILVDSMGLILAVVVTAANVTDRQGALLIFDKIADKWPTLSIVRGDQAYAGKRYLAEVEQTYHRRLEISKPSLPRQGFQVLPSRWVVERTFGWLNHFRGCFKSSY